MSTEKKGPSVIVSPTWIAHGKLHAHTHSFFTPPPLSPHPTILFLVPTHILTNVPSIHLPSLSFFLLLFSSTPSCCSGKLHLHGHHVCRLSAWRFSIRYWRFWYVFTPPSLASTITLFLSLFLSSTPFSSSDTRNPSMPFYIYIFIYFALPSSHLFLEQIQKLKSGPRNHSITRQ